MRNAQKRAANDDPLAGETPPQPSLSAGSDIAVKMAPRGLKDARFPQKPTQVLHYVPHLGALDESPGNHQDPAWLQLRKKKTPAFAEKTPRTVADNRGMVKPAGNQKRRPTALLRRRSQNYDYTVTASQVDATATNKIQVRLATKPSIAAKGFPAPLIMGFGHRQRQLHGLKTPRIPAERRMTRPSDACDQPSCGEPESCARPQWTCACGSHGCACGSCYGADRSFSWS